MHTFVIMGVHANVCVSIRSEYTYTHIHTHAHESQVNSLFSSELRALAHAFVRVQDAKGIRSFYEHLDAVLAFVQVGHVKCGVM
jgi:hypothetical protein